MAAWARADWARADQTRARRGGAKRARMGRERIEKGKEERSHNVSCEHPSGYQTSYLRLCRDTLSSIVQRSSKSDNTDSGPKEILNVAGVRRGARWVYERDRPARANHTAAPTRHTMAAKTQMVVMAAAAAAREGRRQPPKTNTILAIPFKRTVGAFKELGGVTREIFESVTARIWCRECSISDEKPNLLLRQIGPTGGCNTHVRAYKLSSLMVFL